MPLSPKITRLFNKYAVNSSGRLFFSSMIIGVASGLGAILFFSLLSRLNHFCFHDLANFFPPEPSGETSGQFFKGGHVRHWVLILAPVIGALISGFLVFTFAPEAEGHGTDAVIDAFHNKRGAIRKRVPIIKAIASIFTIGTGGSAGREGPIAQIGAGFASYMSGLLKLSDDERRILILAGTAGGIGAIFRSPLGGAIFAVEVLYKRDFEARALIPALLSSIIAYSIFASHYGWNLLFDTPAYTFTNPGELLFYAVMGVICAGMGVVYIKIFYGMRDHFFKPIPIMPQLRPAIGGLLIGLLGFFAPQVLGSGYGYLQDAMHGSLTIKFMIITLFLKILATSFTISSGGSGGVFAPSLFIGGMIGGAFGQIADQLFPNLISNPTAFVLVGMGAFFAGAAKVPLSAMIMVSEMTGGYHLLVPMMLSSATAYAVNSKVSLYEKQVNKMSDSPAHMGDFTIDVLDTLVVDQAFHKNPNIPVLHIDTPLYRFQHLVQEAIENHFPVLDHDQKIVGIVSIRKTRSILFDNNLNDFLIVQDLMSPPVTVTPAESLRSALKKFIEFDYGQIPVVDMRNENKIIGLLNHEDLISAYDKEIVKRKLGK